MVNAKKAEERQRLEEQLSSAELMHLVSEFGRRIKELEGRAAEGDKVRGWWYIAAHIWGLTLTGNNVF